MSVLQGERLASAEIPEGGSSVTPVRLTVDARAWKTGLGTYTLNLMSAIRRVDQGFRIKAIVPAEAADAVSGLCHEMQILETPIYSPQEQLRIPGAVGECDLLHVPHYNVPVMYRGPMVVTIHDLTHLTEPTLRNSAGAWLYARPILRIATKKSRHVFTVSEYSKRMIAERLHTSPAKITVTYPGVSSQFRPMDCDAAAAQVKDTLQVDLPYVLFVGNLKPHKNVRSLVRAFAVLRSRRRIEHRLVLLGSDRKHEQEVLDECAVPELKGVVQHIAWAPQELMPALYSAAALFVMPSRSEGFGSPVLEAMACGTPVACSTAASLPEVGGDAVEYFDPSSVEELAVVMERVLESPESQAKMREKGLRQAAKFTWEECARKHVEVYRSVLAS